MLISRTILGAVACACALSAVAPGVAPAQTMASEPALRRTIHVPRDKSMAYRLAGPASRVVVANPEIAKVTGTSDSSFYVQGVEFGSTNLLVYGPGGRLQEVIDIRVGYDAEGLQQDLAAAFPGEPIQVRNLGETLLLSGEVSHTGVQAKAEEIAQRYAPDAIISRLRTRLAQQVVLEVRVLEATRSALKDMGVAATIQNDSFSFMWGNGLIGASAPTGVLQLTGGAGSTSIDVAILALEEKGIVRTLARPNLVAISGQKATFHAGGEFPYPVPQDEETVSLDFRKYGVELNFTPIVEDNGLIRLDVEPKVSQLDFTNSLRVEGFTVPGLVIRQTRTMVQLRAGESLSIGGLFQREYVNAMRQVPGLGQVPVLGTLFRSARFRRAETELFVIVTPRLVGPADMAAAADLKAPPGQEPTDAALFLTGKSLDRPLSGQEGR